MSTGNKMMVIALAAAEVGGAQGGMTPEGKNVRKGCGCTTDRIQKSLNNNMF